MTTINIQRVYDDHGAQGAIWSLSNNAMWTAVAFSEANIRAPGVNYRDMGLRGCSLESLYSFSSQLLLEEAIKLLMGTELPVLGGHAQLLGISFFP